MTMLEFYDHALPIARKHHVCEYCNKEIVPGEQYSVESGKYLGDFFTRKLCLCCKKILDDYCSNVDFEFDWYDVDEYLSDKFCSNCSEALTIEGCNIDCVALCPIIRKKYLNEVL